MAKSPTVKMKRPMARKGMVLESKKMDLPTGVTFICSIVPASFSLTRLRAHI